MKLNKKIFHSVWLIPMLIVCLFLGGIVVYAAMIVREEKPNRFQIGNLETKVEEVFSEPTTFSPDKPIEKKVSIVNTGTVDQFVRVMLQPEIQIANGENTRLFPAKIGEEIILDFASQNWRLGEDGYYYYLQVVKPGKSNVTDDLFSEVKLNNNLGKEYNKATISLLIKVEAVNCVGDAYRNAWWQGSIPTSDTLKQIDQQLSEKTK